VRGDISNARHVHASLKVTQLAPANDDDRHQADQPAKHNSHRRRKRRSVRAQDDRSERPVKVKEQQEALGGNFSESRP
jgi:hypothetical protein